MSRDLDGILQIKYANSGDVGLGGLDLNELWPIAYSTPGGTFPQRIQFNQLFRNLSALGVEINQKGPFLDYSNIINYSVGASIVGSDGLRYRSVIANGPLSTIVDPVGDSTGTWALDGSVNPRWFGAKADGSTDDTAAFQAAIDSGSPEVEISPGDYIVGDLTPASTLRVLKGNGFPTLTPPAIDTKIIEGTTGSDLLLTGINFKGHAGSPETSVNQLINLTAFSKLKIIGNRFTNGFHRSVYLIGCTDFSVFGNEFINCSNGPYFTGCQRGIISKNIIDGSQQDDDVFKIGIALQTFDATYGLNQDITVSDNVINDLQDSQAILGHGGIGINVHGNVTTGCAQGINFNRQTSGDDILDVSIMNNRCKGVGAGVSYTPAADVGIVVSGTGETTGNVVIIGNTLRHFNLKSLTDGAGGISVRAIDNIVINSNTIQDCASNGIIFIGDNSLNVMVKNNIINNVSGSAAHGGIKVDSPTIVSGIFKDNWITNCDKAYRIETSGLVDLIIESDTESENTTGSTGTTFCLFNRSLISTDLDTTPSVNHNVRVLAVANSGATDMTTLDDGITGQIVVIRFADGNTTVKDISTTGSFVLAGSADYDPGTKDTLTVLRSGTEWLEVSRSDN